MNKETSYIAPTVYQTGWQAINRMLQGGGRRGEAITVAGLPKKYKTKFMLSLMTQFARLNTPQSTAKEIFLGKKPLILRVTLKEDAISTLRFLYQYLKGTEGHSVLLKDIANIPKTELSAYVDAKMSVTGFHVQTLHIKPNQWSYTYFTEKLDEYRAKGYGIHILIADDILKFPVPESIDRSFGRDKREMLRRMRNFCFVRDIMLVTPAELSFNPKRFIAPRHRVISSIAGQGYYTDCKTLDQEMDLEVSIDLFTHQNAKYLAVQRGKHRLPTVISDKDKYCIYRFPQPNLPILEDLDKEDTSLKNPL